MKKTCRLSPFPLDTFRAFSDPISFYLKNRSTLWCCLKTLEHGRDKKPITSTNRGFKNSGVIIPGRKKPSIFCVSLLIPRNPHRCHSANSIERKVSIFSIKHLLSLLWIFWGIKCTCFFQEKHTLTNSDKCTRKLDLSFQWCAVVSRCTRDQFSRPLTDGGIWKKTPKSIPKTEHWQILFAYYKIGYWDCSPCALRGRPWRRTGPHIADTRTPSCRRCGRPFCGPQGWTCSWTPQGTRGTWWLGRRGPPSRAGWDWPSGWTLSRTGHTWRPSGWSGSWCDPSGSFCSWRSPRTPGKGRWRRCWCASSRGSSGGPSGRSSWSSSCKCTGSQAQPKLKKNLLYWFQLQTAQKTIWFFLLGK